MILTLGILSLTVCAALGPFAWFMGRDDLRKMDSLEMDDRDRSLVQGGMICGMIGTLILGVVALFFLLWLGLFLGGIALTRGHPW